MATTVTPSRTLIFVFVLVIVWSNTCVGDTIRGCEKGVLEVDEGSTLHLTCTGIYTWYKQRGRFWYDVNRCSQSNWQACYSYKYTDSGDNYTALAVRRDLMKNIAGTVGCGYPYSSSKISLLEQCNIYVVYPASKVRKCGLQWNTQDWTVSGSCEVDKLSHFDSSVFQCQWQHWLQSGQWSKNIVTTRKINKAGSTCSFSGYQVETSYSADDIRLWINLGSGWMFAKSINIRLPVITEADQQGLIRVKENRKVNLICFVTGLYATRQAYSLDFHCPHMVNSTENRTDKPQSILWKTLTFAPNVFAHNGTFCTCTITWESSRTVVKTTSAQLIVETETRTETNVPTVPWSVTTVLPTKPSTTTPYRPATISISTSEHRHSTTPERIIVVSKKDDRDGDKGDSDSPSTAVIAVVAGVGLLFVVVVVVVIVIVFLVKQQRGKNKHDPKTTTGRNDDFVEYHNDMFVDADTFQPTQANSLVRSRNDFQSPDGVFPFGPQDIGLEEETSYFAISLARSGPSISQNVDTDLHPLAEGNENNATISILATSSGTQPQTRDEYAVVRKVKSKRNAAPQHGEYAMVNKTRSNPRQALSHPSDPQTGNTPSSSSQELYTQVKKKSKGSSPVGNQQLQAEGEIFSPTQKLSSARDPATEERAIATAAMGMESNQTGAEYENLNEIVDQRGQVKDWKAPADVDDDYNTLNFHRMTASQPSGERDAEYSHIGAMGYRY